VSTNAGGLIRWPVYGLIPLGFAILLAQGLSELIKRLAFLTGHGPDPLIHTGPSEAQLLAKEIAEAENQQWKLPRQENPLIEHTMIEFVTNNFVPLMFAGLLIFLLIGFPVAFRWPPPACSLA
jgi:hypothetical protein